MLVHRKYKIRLSYLGGVGVNALSAGGLVYADNAPGGFKRLQDDVQALCAFLGQTVRTDVGSDVADGNTIDSTVWPKCYVKH